MNLKVSTEFEKNKRCSLAAARIQSQKAYAMDWALGVVCSKDVIASTEVLGSSTELTWDLSGESSQL